MIPTIIHNIRSSKFSILLSILLHKISTAEDLKKVFPKCHFSKDGEHKTV